MVKKEQNNPVFYLKINSMTEQHINIFFQWLKIVSDIGADYYVVCDNKRLTLEINDICIERNIPKPKIIKSKREEIKDKIDNIGITDKWLNTAYALLTPFVHASENNIKYFWNIDADDTLFCCPLDKTAEILRQAGEYAVADKLDCFSLDMWDTVCRAKKTYHWSFGVCFINNTKDYFKIIEENREVLQSVGDNIDWKFTALVKNKKIRAKSFYADNLVFEHFGTACFNWRNGELLLLYAIETLTKGIEEKGKNINEIPLRIPPEIVVFSVGALDFSTSVSFRNKILKEPLNRRKLQIPHAPTVIEELWACDYFENYIYGLFTFSEDLIVFMATADTHTPQNPADKGHRILYSLGLKMDFINSFRYSYVAIIDGGIVMEERYSPAKPLVVNYEFDGNKIEITSSGRNDFNIGSINLKVNGIDNICERVRGIHILVYSKSQRKFSDYVCADIYNSNLFNRRGSINAGIL